MNREQRRAAARLQARELRNARNTGDPSAVLAVARSLLREGDAVGAEGHARALVEEPAVSAAARAVLVAALRRQGRDGEAMLEARRAITKHPDESTLHDALGNLLLASDRTVEAIAAFERSVALSPSPSEAIGGLGRAFLAAGALGDAEHWLESYVDAFPTQPAGHTNLGVVRQRKGDYAGSERAYARALELQPESAGLRWNRSITLLGVGDLSRAWTLYESGFDAGMRQPNRRLPVPSWLGGDDQLEGRTLLVWGEQGLGDELRFATTYREIATKVDHLVIESEPRLVSLLARSLPEATVRAQPVPLIEDEGATVASRYEGIDLQAPAGRVAAHVRPTLAAFPDRGDFLVADPIRRSHFRERLAAIGAGPKIGICWRSRNLATERLQHYTTLDEWAPVLAIDGLTLVNLQYGALALRETELLAIEEKQGVHVHRWEDVDYTNDLEAVAALTAELDLVIGPGTFSTILAGALGVPALVLALPAMWQLGTDDDPWAPSTTHLTRRWDEPWDGVFERAASHLRALVAG